MAQKVTKLLKMAFLGHQTFFVAEKVTKLAKTLQRSHFTEFQRFLIRWHGQCRLEEYSQGQKCPKKWQNYFFLPRKLYQMLIFSWLVSPPFLHQRSASPSLSPALGLPPRFSPTGLSIPHPPAQNKPSTWASFDIPSCAESLG